MTQQEIERAIARLEASANEKSVSPHRVVYGTAAPAGTWAVGDICWNTNPSSGGYIGWVCTTAPGTWKGFGVIA
jgi:hypothetical protein